MDKCEISKATLSRIPGYLNYLCELPDDVMYISSTVIARDLGLGDVQVRKDLSLLCKKGRPKIGYVRKDLIKSLRGCLNSENSGTVIVGAGKLGMALLDYSGFEAYGIKIFAAFDNCIDSAVTTRSGKKVYPVGEMKRYCSEHDIRLGVIAVPAEGAQAVLNQLSDCGIKLILSFAPCKLYKPADVVVQYENLALSLAYLKLQINQ